MKPTYRVKKRRKVRKRRTSAPPRVTRPPRKTRKKISLFRSILSVLAVAYLVVIVYFIGTSFLGEPNKATELHRPKPVTAKEPSLTATDQFIMEIAPIAQKMQEEYQILPSIIMSQAILESNSGQSELGRTYNNLFGIKAYGDENQVTLSTQEFMDGKWYELNGTFRVYSNWAESIDDHTQLFVHGVTWDKDLYRPVIEAKTYQEAAVALQEAGYATDPKYSEKIISVIELYELHKYD